MAPPAAIMPAVPAATPANDLNDFVRKRDAFVTAMTMLRNAADTASRTALEYYDVVTSNTGNIIPQFVMNGVQYPAAPGHRAITEEPEEGGKRRRKRNTKPKDPNAPKKPATPFLLFCQTGRETVKTDLGPEATYGEVQEELKRRWENEADKAEWSRVYQKRLGDWKSEMEDYGARKAEAEGTVAVANPVAISPAAARVSTGGFTAVNASATPAAAILAAAATTEDDDDEDEDEEEVAAPAAVTKSPAAAAPAESSDEEGSSLSPPPQKAKAKPGRKPKTPIKPPTDGPAATPATASSVKHDVVTPASEQPKKKRGRPSKKDLEERLAAEATPKSKRAKRRKSGTE